MHVKTESWCLLQDDPQRSAKSSLEGRKCLFNDALDTFYLRLYGRKKGNVYLTTHSTHFIYGYMEGRKCLFNDALNTF